jgi:hypothetical protein
VEEMKTEMKTAVEAEAEAEAEDQLRLESASGRHEQRWPQGLACKERNHGGNAYEDR